MSVRIRPETPADVAAIDAVTVAAFGDVAHSDHTEHFIVRALRDAGMLTISLVAKDENGILGHMAVSPVTISDGARGWYGLGPISVLPERQGEGIGTALMGQALDALRALGAAGCVVLGNPGYYGRFGFRAEPALVLAEAPPAYFQAVALGGGVPSGAVAYHRAFGLAGRK